MNILREIRRTLKEVGFSYGDGIYFRVVNDMFQNVEIRHLSVRKEYIINFGLMPLCAGILNLHQGCFLDLSDFHCLDFPEWCDGWSYLYGCERRKQECEEAVEYSIQRYLLPFMENCKSSNTAYDIYQKTLAAKNESRLLWLRLHNEKDQARKDRHYFDDCLLYLALKNGDYSFAVNALKARNENDLQRFGLIQEPYRHDEKLNGIRATIAQREGLIRYLNNGCHDVVKDILYQREIESLAFLKTFS